ncbi:tRNA (guanine(46)-N(7))-methyltransferase TrmB [Idiomarina xiamenensis]|uniref:tRNA (guanine(46)-N(7))-methyltransferase n=1 Tax=Idiomarina xiamenensis 10-D-4 TaxID=740709 RepID=K2KLH7_9GAMM|nr:methyltransferase domain-containing protein [Idiomarina xiamenensis]EKE87447.1 methyltransferase [Idiomarina xiamenensis 10-D-4]
MKVAAKPVSTNQQGNHDDLAEVVLRHLRSPFQKPLQAHNREAFEQVQTQVEQWAGPLILDACCGVGESTAALAEQHPEALVIGVDKSSHRLARHASYQTADAGQRYLLVRADLNDFWRLAVAAQWQLQKHTILYPNPWPKASHFRRRWHGSPIWPYILALGGELEMRSNWSIYLTEVAAALALTDCQASLQPLLSQHQPMTPFERKYQQSGQQLWQLKAKLADDGGFLAAVNCE